MKFSKKEESRLRRIENRCWFLYFVDVDHIQEVTCKSHPERPINVGAFAISATSIFVVWDKELGDSYNYKVTVDAAGTMKKEKTGSQGFGNAGLVQISGLSEKSQLTVTVRLACKDTPTEFTQARKVLVTTLATGS